jgi:L-lactate permease
MRLRQSRIIPQLSERAKTQVIQLGFIFWAMVESAIDFAYVAVRAAAARYAGDS